MNNDPNSQLATRQLVLCREAVKAHSGATPAVVQRQLRHSDARISLGIYGHVIGDESQAGFSS